MKKFNRFILLTHQMGEKDEKDKALKFSLKGKPH